MHALGHAGLGGIVAAVGSRRVPRRRAPAASFGRYPRGTSRCTTPRRCRPCRGGRSRWAGSWRPARSRPARPRPRRGSGSCPGRCSPSSVPRAADRRPTRTAAPRGRRARRTRTRPRSGDVCRPSARRPRHPRRRSARRADRAGLLRSAARTEGTAPARLRDVAPPARVRIEGDRLRRRLEHDRAGAEILGRRARDLLRRRRAFSDGHVAGRAHEPGELGVRDLGVVHEEPVHVDAVDGTRVVHRLGAALGMHAWIHGAHRELSARNPDHPRGWRRRRRSRIGERRTERRARRSRGCDRSRGRDRSGGRDRLDGPRTRARRPEDAGRGHAREGGREHQDGIRSVAWTDTMLWPAPSGRSEEADHSNFGCDPEPPRNQPEWPPH